MARVCRLCESRTDLCNSHLLPKAEYRRLTSSGQSAPVLMDAVSGKARQTNRQISQKLLCRDCETRFEKYGETPVLQANHHADGTFKLREVIEPMRPVRVLGSNRCYTASQVAARPSQFRQRVCRFSG